jgi:glycosyltransferase involved in cell wall biosynthesis
VPPVAAPLPAAPARDARPRPGARSVVVACPDSRPPAYEAAAGLAGRGQLDRFLTGYYARSGPDAAASWRRLAPGLAARAAGLRRRRWHGAIPGDRVHPTLAFDLALAAENRLGTRAPGLRRALARARTDRFDREVCRLLEERRPDALLAFSDVASEHALPRARALGIPTLLSMVHGDVREERLVLERERERSPDFFPIYLADGPIDRPALEWLHERRLRDLALADAVLVPSDHIAGWLTRNGTPADRVRVVPYAADTRRFAPSAERPASGGRCTFLFAGGIVQRKGIKYLLEAWRRVRRPGWELQLLGGLPADPAALAPYRDEVRWLGRVGHAEVPAVMAAADVFVFPSLFEGSAVVTYEAIACGLPSIVTPAAGSVVRDGADGLVVPAAEVEPLAAAMERLGADPGLRLAMAASARARALAFDWPRYHDAIADAVAALPAPRA